MRRLIPYLVNHKSQNILECSGSDVVTSHELSEDGLLRLHHLGGAALKWSRVMTSAAVLCTDIEPSSHIEASRATFRMDIGFLLASILWLESGPHIRSITQGL